MADASPTIDGAVAAYKLLLRELIDRRPSGTRQRIAEAFGTHRSFVSQITNPSYRVPLPAQHIPALFRVCHFSAEEEHSFLELYGRAHPGQASAIEELAGVERHVLRIPIPDFGDEVLRRNVEEAIRDCAERMIRIAQARSAPPGSNEKDQGGTE